MTFYQLLVTDSFARHYGTGYIPGSLMAIAGPWNLVIPAGGQVRKACITIYDAASGFPLISDTRDVHYEIIP